MVAGASLMVQIKHAILIIVVHLFCACVKAFGGGVSFHIQDQEHRRWIILNRYFEDAIKINLLNYLNKCVVSE